MLRELSVQNLAIIEDVLVELEAGFCVWTGETGAGKSLLLAALGLLIGQRGSSELIRSGADEVRITGRFELNRPELRAAVDELLETSVADGEIIISRRVTAAGRSYAYMNEQPIALTTLRRLGPLLVDIHGQRESQSLLSPAYQLQLLDSFGKLDGLRDEFRRQAKTVRTLRRQLTELSDQRQQRLRDLSLVRFEREELTNAELVQGELPTLIQEREQLRNVQQLREFAERGCNVLNDADGSVVEELGKLGREAENLATADKHLSEFATRITGLVSEAQDLAYFLRDREEAWPSDPARLETVENRIQDLRRLESKYGQTADELVAYLFSLEEKEKGLSAQEESLAEVDVELRKEFDRLIEIGGRLTKNRRKVANRFAKQVMKELADLGMPGAKLDVRLDTRPADEQDAEHDVPENGFDLLEIDLSANAGEPSQPLRKIASGGELSRTMLALKTVLADHEAVGTLVFDEIDANVGGRLGDVLGAKLAQLAKSHQIICVTHLPQVACFANQQWTIRKNRRSNRTFTSIKQLTETERVDELTSMLRGSSPEESTRREADAMLKAAKRLGKSKS